MRASDRLRQTVSEATAGPWKIERDNDMWVNYLRIPYGYDADARLIALAPDLAALLADCLDALEAMRDDLGLGETYGTLADTLLDRAEGLFGETAKEQGS